MNNPNLLVECKKKDIADLITALSFHRGEIERNPYHLSIANRLIDNVMRGTELIKGQGRVLVRKSGTESKIRVMAESDNKILLSRCVNMISKKIK